ELQAGPLVEKPPGRAGVLPIRRIVDAPLRPEEALEDHRLRSAARRFQHAAAHHAGAGDRAIERVRSLQPDPTAEALGKNVLRGARERLYRVRFAHLPAA